MDQDPTAAPPVRVRVLRDDELQSEIGCTDRTEAERLIESSDASGELHFEIDPALPADDVAVPDDEIEPEYPSN